MKIAMMGVGRLGTQLVFNLVSNPKIEEIQIYDIIKDRVEGTILDISHAYPEFSGKMRAVDGGIDADIIIITAGYPRKPEDTRLQLLEKNKKIMSDVLKLLKLTKNTIIIVLTNPVEPLTHYIYKNADLDWRKVIGFSNMLDTARLKYVISKATNVNAGKIKTFIIGEHGEKMIPLFSQTTVGGKKLEEFDVDMNEMEKKTKMENKRILETMGGTQFGPGTHLSNLVNAILNDSNEIFPLSFYLNEEHYSLKDVCVSLPVRVGRMGIKEVVELEINDEEKRRLKELADALKEMEIS